MYKDIFTKKLNKSNVILTILSLIISLSWAIKLDREWGFDFGIYYTAAAFFSDNYELYKEHLEIKGPVYYAFLFILGKIIGFGPLQAIISLFLTAYLFVSTVLYISNKYTKSFLKKLFYILLCGSILFYQTTNASISVFQLSLLLLSFHYLYEQRRTESLKYLVDS